MNFRNYDRLVPLKSDLFIRRSSNPENFQKSGALRSNSVLTTLLSIKTGSLLLTLTISIIFTIIMLIGLIVCVTKTLKIRALK